MFESRRYSSLVNSSGSGTLAELSFTGAAPTAEPSSSTTRLTCCVAEAYGSAVTYGSAVNFEGVLSLCCVSLTSLQSASLASSP